MRENFKQIDLSILDKYLSHDRDWGKPAYNVEPEAFEPGSGVRVYDIRNKVQHMGTTTLLSVWSQKAKAYPPPVQPGTVSGYRGDDRVYRAYATTAPIKFKEVYEVRITMHIDDLFPPGAGFAYDILRPNGKVRDGSFTTLATGPSQSKMFNKTLFDLDYVEDLEDHQIRILTYMPKAQGPENYPMLMVVNSVEIKLKGEPELIKTTTPAPDDTTTEPTDEPTDTTAPTGGPTGTTEPTQGPTDTPTQTGSPTATTRVPFSSDRTPVASNEETNKKALVYVGVGVTAVIILGLLWYVLRGDKSSSDKDDKRKKKKKKSSG